MTARTSTTLDRLIEDLALVRLPTAARALNALLGATKIVDRQFATGVFVPILSMAERPMVVTRR